MERMEYKYTIFFLTRIKTLLLHHKKISGLRRRHNDNSMARILALDYGTKRTGVAVTDPLCIIANALETVPTVRLMEFLESYLSRERVSTIVVGKPLDTKGRPSASWSGIVPFVERLKRRFPDTEVVFHDERFTSVLAHRAIIDGGVRKMARRDKALVDRVSATIILQSYLESKERQTD